MQAGHSSLVLLALAAFLVSPFAVAQSAQQTKCNIQLCVVHVFNPDLIDPAEPIVRPGASVTWFIHYFPAYNFVSGTGPEDPDSGKIFDLGLVMAPNTFTFIFQKAGEYPYYDKLHPNVRHKIIVAGEAISQTEQHPIGTIVIRTFPVVGGILIDGKLFGNGSISVVLPASNYTVTFGSVSGYLTPDAVDVELAGGRTITINSEYTPALPQEPASTTIASLPTAIVSAILVVVLVGSVGAVLLALRKKGKI